MNLEEFAALKPGDKIENGTNNSPGEVVEANASGVRLVWGPRSDRETRFFYSVQSTAWMQWNYAPLDCVNGPCRRDDCRRGGCVVRSECA